MPGEIYKAAGILLKDRKLLVTRSKGKDFFVSPGGKIEEAESPQQALARELMEELTITVSVDGLEPFGVFEAQATRDDRRLRMDVFVVRDWSGKIRPDHEIEEIQWVSSVLPPAMVLGSIFAHEVIPRLKEQGLID